MRPLLLSLLFALSCSTLADAKAKPAPVKPPPMVFLGDIDENSVHKAATELEHAADSKAPLAVLRIRSFGGSVFSGLEFIARAGTAKQMSGMKVVCVVEGYAASMAFVILQSPVCDLRVMTTTSILLAHNASTQAEGNVVEISQQLEFLKRLDRTMALLISRRLGMTVEAYEARVLGKDWTLDWQESLAANAVDKVID